MPYEASLLFTKIAREAVAQFMPNLLSETKVQAEEIHLRGHSLGSIAMSHAARITCFSGLLTLPPKINHLTGIINCAFLITFYSSGRVNYIVE